ncbi:TetR/AcrR family transcriptional regulator [Lacisediminihabitans changchengi]|uniref:TetR/AcrR family transcriptional regulator n=1 Tax=Lacisediminihabitans changchengi TaxID=2787634 RepID=A0A934W4I0_9MICO|nr:TetR/AcrR family transcriptional regulator [Lacisediminihabitans changchengi]MBK4348991.1 TetR/AcrR family transcriptional regulator [Lacisediminihabitans changchengi]
MTAQTARDDPRQRRSRQLILDAAMSHFVRRGYVGGNMDDLAIEAGVAKRTIYNHFAGKDELFRAVVRRAIGTAEAFVAERVDTAIGATPVEEEISAFAVAHARAVLAPSVISTRRLLIGEVERFPELAAEYYERVPARVMRAIAARLRRYHAARLLTVPDSTVAAEHFVYLVLGASLDHALFDSAALDSVTVEQRAISGASAFLRGYLP